MNVSILGCFAFCGLATAVLVGCGGSQSVSVTAPVVGPAGGALKQHSYTFNFTGTEQTFKVRQRVKSITVDAYGGGTNEVQPRGKTEQAFGGRTQATLPVTPGETLYVFVGGDGTTGYNGGGSSGGGGGYCSPGRGFGAGAADVREHGDGLSNRILVAGGAGVTKAIGASAAVRSAARAGGQVDAEAFAAARATTACEGVGRNACSYGDVRTR